MNLQDYFKNSVWESFTSSQGLTLDTTTQIIVSMVVALIMGLDRAQRNLNGGSVYDERGLLTLDW